MKHFFSKNESHGSALMVADGDGDKRQKIRVFQDYVYCLYIPIWPKSTHSWISRERFHGWRSIATISKIVSKGCHVTHRSSNQKREGAAVETIIWLG